MDSRILLVYAIIAIVAIVALVLPVNADPAPPLSLADARVTEGTGPGIPQSVSTFQRVPPSRPNAGSGRYSPMSIQMMPTSRPGCSMSRRSSTPMM